MEHIRICLMQATNPVDVKWNAALGFGYLKANAERLVPDRLEFLAAEDMAEATAFCPDVIGISSTSQDFEEAIRLSDESRAAGIPVIVLGGFHITAFPETLPQSADLGVIGEGEVTFGEVLLLLVEQGGMSSAGLAAIPGLVYWDMQGQLQRTPPRPVVADLDDLPIPDHRFGLNRGRQPYLFTSRGCPYHCSFCASSIYWPNVRFHKAERVIAEMEGIMQDDPSLQAISFWDDLFTANRKRLLRIIELFEERPLIRRLTLVSSIRANLITDDLCGLLERLNYRHVGFGAESGSDAILKKLKDPRYSCADNQRALDTAHRHGFTASAGFVLGHYDETEEDVHATYRFILDNYAQGKLSQHDITILTPMPGTKTWDWAQKQGFVRAEGMAWHQLRYLAMYSNNLTGIDEWVALREQNGSLYLNDHNVPRQTLYQMIRYYEDRIARRELGSPVSPVAHAPVPTSAEAVCPDETAVPAYYCHERSEIVQAVPSEARHILDVGCGGGALGRALKAQDPRKRVVGIEAVPAAAEQARRFLDEVLLADIETSELSFCEGEFDCVVFADVLEHLRDPWAIARRLLRYVRPGGTVIASVPNIRRLSVLRSLADQGDWKYEVEGVLDRTHIRFFTRHTFTQLLEGVGVRHGTIEPLGGAELRDWAPDADGRVRMGRLQMDGVSQEEFEELAALQFLFVGTCDGGSEDARTGWRVIPPRHLSTSDAARSEAVDGPIVFGRGFHDDEGNHRWLARRATLRVDRAATPAVLTFTLTAAASARYRRFPVEVQVTTSGFTPCTQRAFVGNRPIALQLPLIPADGDVVVELTSAEYFVPAGDGQSEDRRELSVVMSQVELRR